jgi:MscS family membrane protein
MMVHIGPWEISFPEALSFIPETILWALTALFTWWIVALVLRFFVIRVLKALARRTESEIEDVIIDVSRRPLVLATILAGLVSSLDALATNDPLALALRRWLVAALILLATYWIWRLLKDVVIHYGERLSQRSETRLDDILLPIVNQFAPLALFLMGGAAALQYLGVRLDALLVALGGAAFILAFALQDILSNIFSGISLLVDTPFRYGDLITLEDGRVCQVVKIGVRVTQLYDINEHAVIYMPNSKLANERLINLMQPTPELFSSIPLELGREVEVEHVLQVVNRALDGHPDLLGEIGAKLELVPTFGILSAAKREHGVQRLSAELHVDETLREVVRSLANFAAEVTRDERRGFSKDELVRLRAHFEAQARKIGMIPDFEERWDHHRGTVDAFLDESAAEMEAHSLAQRTWAWIGIWSQDPDLEPGVDDVRLRSEWATRILSLLRRTQAMSRRLDRPYTLESRLDDAVLDLKRWIEIDFKQPLPPWKQSGVSFKGFQNGGMKFNVYFLVDNIELEHFFRQARVESQVRREIVQRFRQEGIDFASSRHEVAISGGPLDVDRRDPQLS